MSLRLVEVNGRELISLEWYGRAEVGLIEGLGVNLGMGRSGHWSFSSDSISSYHVLFGASGHRTGQREMCTSGPRQKQLAKDWSGQGE